MAIAQGAVDLVRGLRSTAHIRNRQPLATAWLALPDRGLAIDADLLDLIADEVNVKEVVVIADDSALVERRVKPLLPRIGKRLGSAIPAVMAAARAGEVTFESDGSVTLAGVTLAPDEVEIQATPRPGTAVAHHDGLVVVLDTELTPELVAEGDARELARAVQDLRRDAGLELDDRIDLWVRGLPAAVAPHLAGGRHGHAGRPRRRRPAGRRPDRDRGAGRRPGRHRAASPRRRSDAGMSVDVPGEIAGPEVATTGTKRTGAHWLVFLGTGRDGLRPRPDLEGVAGGQPEAGRDRAGHRRLRPADLQPELRRAVRPVPRQRARCSGSCRSSSWR